MPLRLAFMGTPDFAVPALQALHATGHNIACVYSQPARAAGRGQKERPSPVQVAAEKLGCPVRTPSSLKDEAAQQAFDDLALDIAVVVAYGLILPQAILDAPRHGCLNIHASLLPRWRGAAPIQRAILAGDTESGVTIMQMDAGLDTGPTLLMETTPITDATTGESLHDALSEMGSRMIVGALERITAGSLPPIPQPEDGVTYAKKLSRDEARIDWRDPADALERKLRAFTPWPGTWFDLAGQRVKLLEAEVADGKGEPGTVLDDILTVACGEQALRLKRLQRQGKSPMDAADFLRGLAVPAGRILS
jgi:methionyl-tRNA formyltransferase